MAENNSNQQTREGLVRYANNVITCCMIVPIRQLEQDNKP